MAKSNNTENPSVEVSMDALQVAASSGQSLKIEVQNPQRVKAHHLVKHVGEAINNPGGPVVTFLSKRKEFMVFINDNHYLKFAHNVFRTDDAQLISILRTNPLFNLEVFEEEFPKHIKDEMEQDRRYLTRDPDEHEPGYKS